MSEYSVWFLSHDVPLCPGDRENGNQSVWKSGNKIPHSSDYGMD